MNDIVPAIRSAGMRELLKLMQQRVPDEKQDAVAAFLRLYYGQVDPEDIAERAPTDLLGAALSHLAFSEGRLSGHAKVRVFNPVQDRDGWQSTHTIVEISNDDMPFLVDSVA